MKIEGHMGYMPNIENALKIKVEQSDTGFRADAKALPGTPPVGRGQTEDAAKYNLYVKLLYIIANPDMSGGDSGYKPIVAKLLNEDMAKLGS